jgi:deoxyribose-phosphate aldolase
MTALRRTARLEHRLTRPNASLTELDAAVGLVVEHQLAALAVSPWLVKPAARLLARTPVRVATVIRTAARWRR